MADAARKRTPQTQLNEAVRQGFIAVLNADAKQLEMVRDQMRTLGAELAAVIATEGGQPTPSVARLLQRVQRATQLFAGRFENALIGNIADVAGQSEHMILDAVSGYDRSQMNMVFGLTQRTVDAMRIRQLGPRRIALSDRVWAVGYGVNTELNNLIVNAAIVQGAFPSARELARTLQAFLLPGEDPTNADMAAVFGADWPQNSIARRVKTKTPAWQAMRLARTEINQTFHTAVDLAADTLTGTLGIRCVLSQTHDARQPGGDICDQWAHYVAPGPLPRGVPAFDTSAFAARLKHYGVDDSRGVFPPGHAPLEHPNGLCTRQFVLAPLEHLSELAAEQRQKGQFPVQSADVAAKGSEKLGLRIPDLDQAALQRWIDSLTPAQKAALQNWRDDGDVYDEIRANIAAGNTTDLTTKLFLEAIEGAPAVDGEYFRGVEKPDDLSIPQFRQYWERQVGTEVEWTEPTHGTLDPDVARQGANIVFRVRTSRGKYIEPFYGTDEHEVVLMPSRFKVQSAELMDIKGLKSPRFVVTLEDITEAGAPSKPKPPPPPKPIEPPPPRKLPKTPEELWREETRALIAQYGDGTFFRESTAEHTPDQAAWDAEATIRQIGERVDTEVFRRIDARGTSYDALKRAEEQAQDEAFAAEGAHKALKLEYYEEFKASYNFGIQGSALQQEADRLFDVSMEWARKVDDNKTIQDAANWNSTQLANFLTKMGLTRWEVDIVQQRGVEAMRTRLMYEIFPEYKAAVYAADKARVEASRAGGGSRMHESMSAFEARGALNDVQAWDAFMSKKRDWLELHDTYVEKKAAYLRAQQMADQARGLEPVIRRDTYLEVLKELRDFGMTPAMAFPFAPITRDQMDVINALNKQRGYRKQYTSFEDFKHSVRTAQEAIEWAAQFYPTDWLRSAIGQMKNGPSGHVNISVVERGHALDASRYHDAEIFLSPTWRGIHTDPEHSSVAVHELGHHQEYGNSDVRAAEWAFFERRIRGGKADARIVPEAPRWIGAGNANEVGRFDKFEVPYMGRDYADLYRGQRNPRDLTHELLTMGAEAIFTDSNKGLRQDADMRRWLIGLLAVGNRGGVRDRTVSPSGELPVPPRATPTEPMPEPKPSLPRFRAISRWETDLTPEDRRAITSWVGVGYARIRADILQGTTKHPQTAQFLHAIEHAPSAADETLYRGIRLDNATPEQAHQFREQWRTQVGTQIEWKEPSSASLQPKIGVSFGPVVFKLEHSGARHIGGIEQEVIIPPNAKFDVVSAEDTNYNGKSVMLVTLREVSEPVVAKATPTQLHDWETSLTATERKAMLQWVDSGGNKRILADIKQNREQNTPLSPEAQHFLDALERAPLADPDTVLYRGVHQKLSKNPTRGDIATVMTAELERYQHAVGTQIEWTAPASTTTDRKMAELFGYVQFKITKPRRAVSIEQVVRTEESEYITLPNTRYLVKAVTPFERIGTVRKPQDAADDHLRFVVELEEVDTEPPIVASAAPAPPKAKRVDLTKPTQAKAVYDVEYNGIRAEPTLARMVNGKMEVTGSIVDIASDKEVGNFVRIYDPKTKTMKHDRLQVDDEFQGRGFGSEFFAQTVERYRAAGVQKIETEADINIGGYVWATKGFDFAEAREARRTMKYVADNAFGGNEPGTRRLIQADDPTLLPKLDAKIAELRAKLEAGTMLSAYDLSQWGRDLTWIDADGRMMWIGKRGMLASNWLGVLRL